MKDKCYCSNIALAVVLGGFLIVCALVRTFVPLAVLPELTVPNVVQLSLAALVAAHYLCKGKKSCLVIASVLAALTFGLLPFAAGFATGMDALKLALVGGAAWFVIAWLFGQITDRISTGPTARLAPIFSALGLYLAFQCFAGMIL